MNTSFIFIRKIIRIECKNKKKFVDKQWHHLATRRVQALPRCKLPDPTLFTAFGGLFKKYYAPACMIVAGWILYN